MPHPEGAVMSIQIWLTQDFTSIPHRPNLPENLIRWVNWSILDSPIPTLHMYTDDIFDATANLLPMWRTAGVADALYDSDGRLARDVEATLGRGLQHMREHPDVYTVLNPSNGWGNYEGAMQELERAWLFYRALPGATIRVSR